MIQGTRFSGTLNCLKPCLSPTWFCAPTPGYTRKERSKGHCVRRWRRCFGAVSTLACRGRGPTRSGGRARADRPEGGKAARHRLTPADRAAKSGREIRHRKGLLGPDGSATSERGRRRRAERRSQDGRTAENYLELRAMRAWSSQVRMRSL